LAGLYAVSVTITFSAVSRSRQRAVRSAERQRPSKSTSDPSSWSITLSNLERSTLHYFSLAPINIPHKIKAYEKLCEDPVFDSGRSDLHGNFCRGQAELQRDWQELPHERQQRMQLREKLRLR
jgi:hypothetical protein